MDVQSLNLTRPTIPIVSWSQYFLSYVTTLPEIWYVIGADLKFVRCENKKMLVSFVLSIETNKMSTGLHLNPFLPLDRIQDLIQTLEQGGAYHFQFDNVQYSFWNKEQWFSVSCRECVISKCLNHYLIARSYSLIEALRNYLLIRENGLKID
jgi:hypothetical protein